MAQLQTVDWQMKIMCCGGVLFMCVIGALLSGLCFFKAFYGMREVKVALYQEAIDEWDNSKKQEFDNLIIQIEQYGDSSGVFKEYNLTHGEEVLDHDYYGTLPSYDATYYKQGFSPEDIGFEPSYEEFDEELTTDIRLRIEEPELNHVSFLDIPDIKIFKKETVESANGSICNRRGDQYDKVSHTCSSFSKVTGFCIKISQEENTRKWVLNDTLGGYDCTGDEHHSDPFTYSKIFIEHGNTIENYEPFSLD